MKGINKDGSIGIFEQAEALKLIRHTAAHVLGQAVKRLWPEAKLAYGPATEKGFYYDVDMGENTLSAEQLPQIEEEMRRICHENYPIKPFILNREEAVRLLQERNEDYKLEHAMELDEKEAIGFYRQGEFIDMCAGPHLTYTKSLKVFKLTGLSGAYWKNDCENRMLTRIHGVAFACQEELDRWAKLQAEAERRDHRRIGSEMELFMFCEQAAGFPFLLPKGLLLKNALIDYWREIHSREGYLEIATPMIMNRQLWEVSGHWEHYRDIMYSTSIDDEDYCIKPMNCPGGILVYKSRPRSYRELPIRMGELGLVHRNELHGTLHGLFRVRCFTQDDAHIFMRREQITDEIRGVVSLIDEVYGKFGFAYSLELSTRPENSMGSDADWEAATRGLQEALEILKLPYSINEGDGAFYGPKIDFHLEDALGRTWQCGTIQLDFQLPQNFELEYVDAQGEKQRPIMLHRVCFGSIERFLGILTEHYEGKFPLWLAPVQVKVLPVSEKSAEYAREVCETLCRAGLRAELDSRSEKIGYKIREAQLADRVPYMVILGQREMDTNTISLRRRDSAQTEVMVLEAFVQRIEEEAKLRL